MQRIITLLLALVALGAHSAASAQTHEPEALQFVRWTEPVSQLYSAEVPQGWHVEGSIINQLGAAQPTLIAYAPDNKATLIVGLNAPHVYALPTDSLAVGDSISHDGTTLTAQPLQTPLGFLQTYLSTNLLGSVCADIVLEPLPVASTADAELRLVCVQNGGSTTGYFRASVEQVDDLPFGSAWMVSDLRGYLAAPGHESHAQAALDRLTQTLVMRPQHGAPDALIVW